MQTVNYQCGNCGNLMAVEATDLGQQVHCPHCRQAVQTHAPEPGEAASASTFSLTVAPEPESIFNVAEPSGDALLFGSGASAEVARGLADPPPALREPPSRESIFGAAHPPEDALFGSAVLSHVELPFHHLPPSGGLPPAEAPLLVPPPSSDALAGEPSATWTAAEPPAPVSAIVDAGAVPPPGAAPAEFAVVGTGLPEWATAGAAGTEFTVPTVGDSGTGLNPEPFAAALPRRRVSSGLRGGLFIALVFIPLISYSVLATIAVAILYFRPPQPSLEYLPDVDGDLRGAKHPKRSLTYKQPDADMPLPDRLKVGLGQSLRLGDVEVTPRKVELSRILFRQGDADVDQPEADSLVLHLVLQNVSQDVVFSPTDPYFDRQWKSSQDTKPYSFLELGDRRFYGGPLPWRPGRQLEERKTVEGQHYRLLQPGERLDTVVCTDPTEPVARVLADHHGNLLWRVQVRRGLVRVGDREVPATAVVGVRFRATDIHKPQT